MVRPNVQWRILIGRSKDVTKWTKAQQAIHTSAGTGNWECLVFFPVSKQGANGLDTSLLGQNVKHVLKVSLDATRYEYYTLGTYYPEKDRYIPDNTSADGWKGLRYDYGHFYASKSFFDPSRFKIRRLHASKLKPSHQRNCIFGA